MKILIVSDVFPPKCGGVGWGAFYLAKALQKEGHKVTAVTVFGESEEYKGVRILRCPPKGSKELAHKTLRKFLKKLLKKEKFDLINAHHVIAMRAAAGLDIPVAATVNDYWPACYKGTLFNSKLKTHYGKLTWKECAKSVWYENKWGIKLLSPFIIPYMKWRTWSCLKALRKANAISFLSKDNQQKMGGLVKDIPQNLTYHICAPDIKGDSIKAKKFDRPTLVFTGKFNVNKGAFLVVDIAKLLPDIDVVMVGGTKDQLKEKCPLPDNLKIIRYIPNAEVFSYMKGADAFIAPALWHEPFGRIVVEAMAMGAIPIVSKRGGMASDIVRDGKSGIIVDPPTAENFAEGIKKLLRDKKKQKAMSKQAQKDFKERFNEELILQQFMTLYDNAIKNYHQHLK